LEFLLYRIGVTIFLPINVVLRHLSIDGHSRPAELLGGLADIPIGGDEHRKQRIALVQRKGLGITETAAELLGQVRK
jgi:hypothetical protein